jgi:hypothetical protein
MRNSRASGNDRSVNPSREKPRRPVHRRTPRPQCFIVA